MAKTNTIPAIQNVNNVDGVINNATGTGKVTVWTAGANDSVLKSFALTSSDTVAHVVNVYINVGGSGTDRQIGAVTVPVTAGTDGATPTVDVLAALNFTSVDGYGNRVLNAKAGTTIKISSQVTVTSGKEIDASGEGGDF